LGKICENLAKIPKNLDKIPENPNKIPKYLSKILENLGKNSAKRSLDSNMAPNDCSKTSKDHSLGGHTKKRSEKIARLLFGQVWEKLGKNPLLP